MNEDAKNISGLAKERCYGCFACEQICPKSSITMEFDDEGFYYPHVNKKTCINCGLCVNSCPVLNESINKIYLVHPSAYGVVNNNDEVRFQSSSGGGFSMLVDYILSRGGVVVGAKYDLENMRVIQSLASTKFGASGMRKSKYVQSYISDTFKNVLKELKNGKYILYSGTPCQIAGLYGYLQKDYERLFTCDIVCHGVPSPGLFTKYFSDLEKNFDDKIVNIDFRTKAKGWGSALNFFIEIEMKKRTSLVHSVFNLYYLLFLSNLSLRPCCYECKFSSMKRVADLTLGDFWGINKVKPELNDGKGTSLVIINTDKGKRMLESVAENAKVSRCEIAQCIQHNLVSPTEKPYFRSMFFKDMNRKKWIIVKLQYYVISILTIICSKSKSFIKKKFIPFKEF